MENAETRINSTVRKIMILAALAIGIYLVFRFLLPLVLPFVIAGVVSVLYYPVLRKVCTKLGVWSGRKKKWILVLAVIFFYAALFFLLCWLGCYLLGQGQSILLNFPFYQVKVMCLVKECCCRIDVFFHIEDGACFTYVEKMVGDVWGSSMSGVLPKVTTYSVRMLEIAFQILFSVIIMIIATFFMIQDYDEIRGKMLQSEAGKNICHMITKCKDTLKTYVRAQGFIMLLDGILCTVTFLAIKQPYALVLGPLVAVVDALPIVGAGLVLLPYALFLFLSKKIGAAGILLLAYFGCLLIRQITEPRMIGGKIGMKPLYTIISMYAGVKLFGVYGFLLGPVGVLLGKELYSCFETLPEMMNEE